MQYEGNIRIFTEKKHSTIYNQFKSKIVNEFNELFFACASIGFKLNKKTPLKKREERFWSRTFTTEQFDIIYSMILSENNFNYESIKDDGSVFKIMEEYANTGMIYLIDEFLNTFIKDENDNISFITNEDNELRKLYFTFIYNFSKEYNN